MSTIEKFKNKLPQLADDVDGYDIFCEIYGEEDVNELIREHYDGREIVFCHPSGNPELEFSQSVSGFAYLKHYYVNLWGIDYKKAYNDI